MIALGLYFMPKVIGPLFSGYAKGNLGKVLNFFLRGESFIVRKLWDRRVDDLFVYSDYSRIWRFSVDTWHNLHPDILALWAIFARDYAPQGNGFNSFMSHYVYNINRGITPSVNPPY